MIRQAAQAVRRAALYSRVSTRKEEQERALDAHLARLRAEAERRGVTVAIVETDQLSGATADRAGYQRIRAAIAGRLVDLVIAPRLDRLARSVRELVDLAAACEQAKVDLVFLDQAIDTSSPGGRLLFHVLAAIAEFERDLIAERVRRGIEAARARGARFGRPRKGMGGLEEEARRLRAEGLSYRAIADRIRRSTAKSEGQGTLVSKDWVARVTRESGCGGER